MIAMLFLATVAASSPVEARLLSVDLRRPGAAEASWYNRISVELESRDQHQIRLCPDHVSVLTERRDGAQFTPVDRFFAHAMSGPSSRGYAASCRDVTLAPGRPQTLTFLVRGVPGRWRGEDRYTLVVEAGATRFRFVEEPADAP